MGACLSAVAPKRAEGSARGHPPTLLGGAALEEGKRPPQLVVGAEVDEDDRPLVQFARRASQVDCSKPRLLLVSDNLPLFELLIRAAKDSTVVVPVRYATWSLQELAAAVRLRAGQPCQQFASVGLLDHGAPGSFCLLRSEGGGWIDLETIKGSPELQECFRLLASYVEVPEDVAHFRENLAARVDLMNCSVFSGAGHELIAYLEELTKTNWAASTNETGHGHDWILESDEGLGDVAASYFNEDRLKRWKFTAEVPNSTDFYDVVRLAQRKSTTFSKVVSISEFEVEGCQDKGKNLPASFQKLLKKDVWSDEMKSSPHMVRLRYRQDCEHPWKLLLCMYEQNHQILQMRSDTFGNSESGRKRVEEVMKELARGYAAEKYDQEAMKIAKFDAINSSKKVALKRTFSMVALAATNGDRQEELFRVFSAWANVKQHVKVVLAVADHAVLVRDHLEDLQKASKCTAVRLKGLILKLFGKDEAVMKGHRLVDTLIQTGEFIDEEGIVLVVPEEVLPPATKGQIRGGDRPKATPDEIIFRKRGDASTSERILLTDGLQQEIDVERRGEQILIKVPEGPVTQTIEAHLQAMERAAEADQLKLRSKAVGGQRTLMVHGTKDAHERVKLMIKELFENGESPMLTKAMGVARVEDKKVFMQPTLETHVELMKKHPKAESAEYKEGSQPREGAKHVVISTRCKEPWFGLSVDAKAVLLKEGFTVYNPNTDNKEIHGFEAPRRLGTLESLDTVMTTQVKLLRLKTLAEHLAHARKTRGFVLQIQEGSSGAKSQTQEAEEDDGAPKELPFITVMANDEPGGGFATSQYFTRLMESAGRIFQAFDLYSDPGLEHLGVQNVVGAPGAACYWDGHVDKFGSMHGYGTGRFENGAVYQGEYMGGRKHGKGTLRYADGSAYEGGWQANFKHGHGSMKYADGSGYTGNFVKDYMHGSGTFRFADGSTYNGGWQADKKHGQGTVQYANGSSYTGTFANDVMQGNGTCCYADGSTYEGQWACNSWHGMGTRTLKNGTVLRGRFCMGEFKA